MRPPETPQARLAVSQMTPLAIDGILYLATPYSRIVALDGDSGRVIWTHVLPDGDQVGGRGMEYWAGDGKVGPRLFYGTRGGLLGAIDLRSGKPAPGFATVNLKTADVMNGMPDAAYAINSAPVVAGNVVITGSRVQESPAIGPNGDVRGWDARTGKLLWTFHSIPRPGEPGHGSWTDDGWKRRSGVNVWNLMSVDRERGIAFLPFAAPAYDRIGVDRKGANLFSSTLVAVDVRTGRYLWHFQAVHHDIWDYDLPGQPTLFDVKRNGRTIPAVAAVSKTGFIFLLDRRNGKPIYKVTEMPVPPSSIAGEEASPTQPVPSAPPSISRQSMTLDDIATLTPEHRQYCLDRIRDEKLTFAAPFEPLRSDHPTIRFPGSGGGPNLGGGTFDPQLGYYIINTTEVASVEQMGRDPQGNWYNVGKGPGAFADRGRRWMCHTPPWGQISAVNVHDGTIAWQVPLGVTDSAPAGKQATGRPNIGGPMATASGLVFVGATDDARFRAFESRSGKELWTMTLEAAAHATPITFTGKSGRQHVAIVSAGGSYLNSRANVSQLVVFALPQ